MEFKTINIYRSPADLIRDYGSETFSDEIMDYLDHVNDFEPLYFLVINGSDVVTVDEIGGDVISTDPLQDFIRQSVEYAKEEL